MNLPVHLGADPLSGAAPALDEARGGPSRRGLMDCSTAWPEKGSADLFADLAAAVPVEEMGNLLAVPCDVTNPRVASISIALG